jgi:hypothetical protein
MRHSPAKAGLFGRSGPEFPIGTFRSKSIVIERSGVESILSADPWESGKPHVPPKPPHLGVHNRVKKVTVCQEPYERLCVARTVRTVVRCKAGRGEICAMPSAEYFRRQADICLRLSLVASDEVVSTLLIAMAQDYAAQADALSNSELVAIVAQDASPDRETSEAQDEERST